jgi:ArsR family transcriptional regulator
MKRSATTTPLTDRLSALSELLRLRICRLLECSELSVGEVAKVVQLPQSTVSRHLKVLSDAGFLQRRAEATATLYRLTADDLDAPARALWASVSPQLQSDHMIEDDQRRLEMVLAERRLDSLAFFGRFAGAWDEVRQTLFGSRFTLHALLGLLPADWTVADVGCGTGNAAELVAPFVQRVIAIDQSEPMLSAARKRLAQHSNITFVDGPVEAIPLEDACVDASLAIMVMHHVAEPADALAEMRRITRPGGVALVVDMLEHDRVEYRRMMGHKHQGFSDAEVRRLMHEAGFTGVRGTALPPEAEAKGPGLFAATAHVASG